MIEIRRADERGAANHGWLDTRYSFSFSDYYDPDRMGFRGLRVMNEDRVAPGAGFPLHGHRDMEILTFVLAGALEHRDSLGNGEVLRPGEVQRMTAGTGIRHSEFNPSADEPVHLYQVWITPDREGRPPGYDQRRFDPAGRAGRLQVVASADGREASLTIQADASVYLADLAGGAGVVHSIAPGRAAWLQVLRGSARVGEASLAAGDGLAVEGEPSLEVVGAEAAEVLLFDLA